MSRLQAGLIAFVALVIGVVLAINIAPPSENNKTQHVNLYPQVRALPDFQLVDHNNQSFTSENLKGYWSLVFVGYTYCPDICPTTLAELNNVYPELQKIPTDFPVQVVLLSVDPKRDTPERLNEYINFFHPDFIAVSGEHSQLFPLVRAMGMMYSMSESTDNPNYLVDHSSSVVVVNPNAQVVGRFKPEFVVGKLPISEGQKILADMPAIMSQ
ncbi:SCO family protein [Paraglaciecola sp. MB-3u-78]|jgi:protein SCO1/2|uniref:SCO family protein n=1 Tax=Paraglaciecola sp. MB-3u-78 TaxID=2058332 RepID=UPI000C3314BA|nr:SCO family protein [Paraglaciecola sp. MB-3u-78]PKG97688.1 SCO family protein [Paraglaciecola sp. MB-3u-78]